MSGKNVTTTNKDGTPDRRTVEGKEAVAAGKAPSAGEAPAASTSAATGDNYHPTEHRDKDGVPLTKDGNPDRRTVEGREAADQDNKSENKEHGHNTRSSSDNKEHGHNTRSSSENKEHGHNTRSSKHHETEFEEGDHVVFNIGSNNLHGTISKVITEDVEVDGRIAHGTKDEPRYAVKYDDTGVEQIRTGGALQKDEGQSTNDAGGKYSERTGSGSANSKTSGSDASGTYHPTEHKSKDGVPLTKDGNPDRRTVEGREAAESEQKDNSSSKKKDHKSHDFKEGQTVVFRVGKHEIHGKIHNVKGVSENDAKSKKESDDKHIASKKESKDKGEKEPEHKFNEGDAVTFNIGLNELHGKITKVITSDDIVDGRVAHGTKDEPRYAVEYEGTGKEQIRTESALKEDDDKMSEDKSNNKRKREDDKDSKDSSKDKATSSPSPKKTKSK